MERIENLKQTLCAVMIFTVVSGQLCAGGGFFHSLKPHVFFKPLANTISFLLNSSQAQHHSKEAQNTVIKNIVNSTMEKIVSGDKNFTSKSELLQNMYKDLKKGPKLVKINYPIAFVILFSLAITKLSIDIISRTLKEKRPLRESWKNWTLSLGFIFFSVAGWSIVFNKFAKDFLNHKIYSLAADRIKDSETFSSTISSLYDAPTAGQILDVFVEK